MKTLSNITWVRKLFGSTISAPYDDIATFMSSLLHAQVSVLKPGLTWSHCRLSVLLNSHKLCADGNFKVTFFKVIMFGDLDGQYRFQTKQQSIADSVNNDVVQKQGTYGFHGRLHVNHIHF